MSNFRFTRNPRLEKILTTHASSIRYTPIYYLGISDTVLIQVLVSVYVVAFHDSSLLNFLYTSNSLTS